MVLETLIALAVILYIARWKIIPKGHLHYHIHSMNVFAWDIDTFNDRLSSVLESSTENIRCSKATEVWEIKTNSYSWMPVHKNLEKILKQKIKDKGKETYIHVDFEKQGDMWKIIKLK